MLLYGDLVAELEHQVDAGGQRHGCTTGRRRVVPAVETHREDGGELRAELWELHRDFLGQAQTDPTRTPGYNDVHRPTPKSLSSCSTWYPVA